MNDSQWEMRVEGGLSASFIQPDGSSRHGTDWAVRLKRGEREYKVMVRSYLSEDSGGKAMADTNYQVRAVLEHLNSLLSQGWTPDRPGNLTITIKNPTDNATGVKKRGWRFW